MRSRSSIVWKGLLLFATPLLVQAVVFGMLVASLADTSRAQDLAMQTKVVLGTAREIFRDLTEGAGGVRQYLWIGAEVPQAIERAQAARDRVPYELVRLEQLVSGDPEQRVRARQLAVRTLAYLKYLDSQDPLIAADREVEVRDRVPEGSKMLVGLRAIMEEFQFAEEQTDRQRVEQLNAMKVHQARVLLGGGLLMILTSGLVGVLFLRGIAERLTVLRDNARRLADGESLAAPLRGRDEITEVDRAFHEMAAGLEDQARLQREIAERRRVEEELRQSERRYRELTESLPLFVWTVAPEGRVEYASRSWHDYTGAPAPALDGPNPLAWAHPEDRAVTAARWSEAIARGSMFEAEHRVRGLDGAYRWFASRAVPFRDASGRVLRWIGTTSDIHELKRMEEALRQADRRKDEFLAMLAHELRNPLAPIRNAARILGAEGPSSPHFEWAVSLVENQVAHLARLVDDLLDVARITRGKIVLRPERALVADVVSQAIQACRPAIEASGHELTVHVPEGPIAIMADPARLAQIITNLLQNAVKYTDRGGRITVVVESDDREATIRVRDNGIGIAPEVLPRIFDLFSQADQSLSRSQGGLGIGLTLVRSLVELHGGRADATSEGLGHGSEFVVRLPRALPAVPGPEWSEPTREGPATPTGLGRRILIVDDNRGNLQTLAVLLRREGHSVQTAEDGASALRLLEIATPEIVLLDIGLPDLDGYEVRARARAGTNAEAPEVFWVAMTGYGQDEDRRRSRDAGFNAHLVKPVDITELAALIGSVRSMVPVSAAMRVGTSGTAP